MLVRHVHIPPKGGITTIAIKPRYQTYSTLMGGVHLETGVDGWLREVMAITRRARSYGRKNHRAAEVINGEPASNQYYTPTGPVLFVGLNITGRNYSLNEIAPPAEFLKELQERFPGAVQF